MHCYTYIGGPYLCILINAYYEDVYPTLKQEAAKKADQ